MIEKRNLLYTISSFLVIVLHNDYTKIYKLNNININSTVQAINDVLCYGLTRVAIPCFMFFSGLLFWRNISTIKDVFIKIKKRIKTLFIPYLIWNIISVTWSLVISIVPFLNRNTAVRKEIEVSFRNVIDGVFLAKYNLHNWYLLQLIIFVIISPVIYYLLKNRKISILFIATVYILYIFRINLPIYIQEHSGIYYFSGAFIGKHFYDNFIKFSNNKMHSKFINKFGYLVLCIALEVYSFCMDLDSTNSAIIWLISGMLLWLVINNSDINVSPNYLQYSYFTYLSHFIIAPCVNKMIWLFLPHNSLMLIFTLLGGAIITFTITIVLGYAIRKYISPLWFLLTGEKNINQ